MNCFGGKRSGDRGGGSKFNKKIYRCKIVLLDDTELIHEIKESQKGQDILDLVFKHLDLLETVYFGLRFVDAKGYSCWLDPIKPVLKQIKSIDPITFFFGVKFYASDPCKLREECTRYQFFLQLKQDVQRSRLPVTNELAAQLLAYIVQSELGDYDPKIHQFGYISEFCWIDSPPSVEFENAVCDLHKKLIGQVPAVVEMQFLERVKWLDLYGCEQYPVVAEDRHEYFLGMGPHGIMVLKNKLKIGNYFWPRIEKVWHKGKFFMMKVVVDKNNQNKTYGFEMLDRAVARRIHQNCNEHKEFFKLSQSVRIQNLFRHIETGKAAANLAATNGASVVRVLSQTDFDRPNPSLVRISSWRLKRHGRPDGSDGPEATSGVHMPRFNSTPSLNKSSPPQSTPAAEYSSPYNKPESGLFSKSASASPLSVRSAFVARYDYGRNNYVSPMKRNNSSLSYRKSRRRGQPPDDFDDDDSDNDDDAISDISRRSRGGGAHSDIGTGNRRKSRSHRNSSSSSSASLNRRRRHHHRHHGGDDAMPQMVEWNDMFERRRNMAAAVPPVVLNGGNNNTAVVKKIGHQHQKYQPEPATVMAMMGMMRMTEQEMHYSKLKSNHNTSNATSVVNPDRDTEIIFGQDGGKIDDGGGGVGGGRNLRQEARYKSPPLSSSCEIGSKFKSSNGDNQSRKPPMAAAPYHFESSRDNLISNNHQHSTPRVTFESTPRTAYYYSNNGDVNRHFGGSGNNNNNDTRRPNRMLPVGAHRTDSFGDKIWTKMAGNLKSPGASGGTVGLSRNEMSTEL